MNYPKTLAEAIAHLKARGLFEKPLSILVRLALKDYRPQPFGRPLDDFEGRN